jgi:hypothetical protein
MSIATPSSKIATETKTFRKEKQAFVCAKVPLGRDTFSSFAAALEQIAKINPRARIASFGFDYEFVGNDISVVLTLQFVHKDEAASAKLALKQFTLPDAHAEKLTLEKGEKTELSFLGPDTVEIFAKLCGAFAKRWFIPFNGQGIRQSDGTFKFQFDLQISSFTFDPTPDLYAELRGFGFTDFDPPTFTLRAWRNEGDPE